MLPHGNRSDCGPGLRQGLISGDAHRSTEEKMADAVWGDRRQILRKLDGEYSQSGGGHDDGGESDSGGIATERFACVVRPVIVNC